MDLTARYKQAIIKLRPKGKIWKVRQGSLSDREFEIWAAAFAKLHEMTEQLFTESLLSETKDFLEEWEDVYDLPHEGSYEERILALLAANEAGNQTPAFYKRLAEKAGVAVEIVEHCPFMFGASSCGADELGAEDIIYYWEVVILAGLNENIEKIKRLMGKYKQSHTVLTFIDKRSGD